MRGAGLLHALPARYQAAADRRRRIVTIAPDYAAPIAKWLSGSAAAWTEVLAALTPAERATVVGAMRACEAALEQHASAPQPGSWVALQESEVAQALRGFHDRGLGGTVGEFAQLHKHRASR